MEKLKTAVGNTAQQSNITAQRTKHKTLRGRSTFSQHNSQVCLPDLLN